MRLVTAQASYGGEDAFFITQQGSTAFGVADGVGGWANSGINPAGVFMSLNSNFVVCDAMHCCWLKPLSL